MTVKPRSVFTLALYATILIGCSRAPQTSPPVQPQRDDVMSADFKEQAWRAYDAIDRTAVYFSTGREQRKLDAEKAFAEAKYKVVTKRDKEILQALDRFHALRNAEATGELLDKMLKALSQCDTELMVEFPNYHKAVTEEELKIAAKRTCVSLADEFFRQ